MISTLQPSGILTTEDNGQVRGISHDETIDRASSRIPEIPGILDEADIRKDPIGNKDFNTNKDETDKQESGHDITAIRKDRIGNKDFNTNKDETDKQESEHDITAIHASDVQTDKTEFRPLDERDPCGQMIDNVSWNRKDTSGDKPELNDIEGKPITIRTVTKSQSCMGYSLILQLQVEGVMVEAVIDCGAQANK